MSGSSGSSMNIFTDSQTAAASSLSSVSLFSLAMTVRCTFTFRRSAASRSMNRSVSRRTRFQRFFFMPFLASAFRNAATQMSVCVTPLITRMSHPPTDPIGFHLVLLISKSKNGERDNKTQCYQSFATRPSGEFPGGDFSLQKNGGFKAVASGQFAERRRGIALASRARSAGARQGGVTHQRLKPDIGRAVVHGDAA